MLIRDMVLRNAAKELCNNDMPIGVFLLVQMNMIFLTSLLTSRGTSIHGLSFP